MIKSHRRDARRVFFTRPCLSRRFLWYDTFILSVCVLGMFSSVKKFQNLGFLALSRRDSYPLYSRPFHPSPFLQQSTRIKQTKGRKTKRGGEGKKRKKETEKQSKYREGIRGNGVITVHTWRQATHNVVHVPIRVAMPHLAWYTLETTLSHTRTHFTSRPHNHPLFDHAPSFRPKLSPVTPAFASLPRRAAEVPLIILV